MHLKFVVRSLDLTEAQSARIGSLMKARRDAAESSRPSAEAARRALAEQVQAETFDEAAIRSKAAAIEPFESDRAVADAALLRDVRASLTSEQRATFDRLMALSPPPPPPPLPEEDGAL
jgi:Spy/CpxP family protein refolding chaperone